jgi:tetraprenyl-beta-curcumene synthase
VEASAASVFARATCAYWLSVFPAVCRGLEHWRARALEIPDPALRAQALEALDKRGNMEGAAAFAAFAPREARAAVVTATVAFQTAYNHLDVATENWRGEGGAERVRDAHRALPSAVQARRREPELGLPGGGCGEDGGYLAALVAACREAVATLPAWAAAAPGVSRAAELVVSFQAAHTGDDLVCARLLGDRIAGPGSDLSWWEGMGAAGSSLAVHALIAAAAEPGLSQADAYALERAYLPAIAALHTMLDHLVDRDEDRKSGQANLFERYDSPAQAVERIAALTRHALTAARGIGPGSRHELIVAAMAAFYLSAPTARTGSAREPARAVRRELGLAGVLSLAVFAARDLAGSGPTKNTYNPSSRPSISRIISSEPPPIGPRRASRAARWAQCSPM